MMSFFAGRGNAEYFLCYRIESLQRNKILCKLFLLAVDQLVVTRPNATRYGRGRHVITYSATDLYNLTTICTFSVVVEGKIVRSRSVR